MPPLPSLIAAAPSLRARSVHEIVDALGRAGARFLDPSDPLRREAEARLPDEAAYSPPMARRVIESMARDWTADRLRTALEADFPDPTVLDGFRDSPTGDALHALGADLTLQIVSGSVPGVGGTALLRSLLVKSPTLIKPGRGDRALTELLSQAIREADPGLGAAHAVIYWPGGEGGALEEEALGRAGCVVVYGDDETILSVRARTRPSTTFVAYPHRVSAGAVGKGVLTGEAPARQTAFDAAEAVALLEQRGCVSPHVIWVEEGGVISPARWAALLAEAMNEVAELLPPLSPDPDLASALAQLKGTAELRAAASRGDQIFSGKANAWTVLYDPEPAFAPSCLGRTVRVKPIHSLEELPAVLAPIGAQLQTLALEGAGEGKESERYEALTQSLARAGVLRITRFRRQPFPPAWWRHDGKGPLETLVRWVVREDGSG